uniref:Alpha/beta hydrolase fold-3 domain-containing protein n=2 Tax=Phaeomonas parva TaxID=124430 RepID=A0A7S1UFJ4_9STRA
MGAGDPVLPSGVLTAISQSYMESSGVSPEHPCASPYFASDEVLKAFPPVLIQVSAVDPLLDDAVDFNTRIRRVGGISEIRATHHVPHAFWGLSGIGFPEVRSVHQYCEAWILNVFGEKV